MEKKDRISVGYYVNSNPDELRITLPARNKDGERVIETIDYPIENIVWLEFLVEKLSSFQKEEQSFDDSVTKTPDPIPEDPNPDPDDGEDEEEEEWGFKYWIIRILIVLALAGIWFLLLWSYLDHSKEQAAKKELLSEVKSEETKVICQLDNPFEVLSKLDVELQSKQDIELQTQQQLRLKKAWKTEWEKALINSWLDASKRDYDNIRNTRRILEDLKIKISNILN